MRPRRWLHGGVLGFIGFMLSPLSWWNDAFVNIPLAIAFGWLVSLLYKPAFEPAVLVGYWLSNVLGFVLMHKGAEKVFAVDPPKPYSKKAFARDMTISLLYTGLIMFLFKARVLQPLDHYLGR
jgi:hypothetical protein